MRLEWAKCDVLNCEAQVAVTSDNRWADTCLCRAHEREAEIVRCDERKLRYDCNAGPDVFETHDNGLGAKKRKIRR